MRFCATTFVQEGTPDTNHAYNGSTLLRCTRCQMTYYKCKEAQKASWKLHKKTCKIIISSDKEYVESLSLLEAVSEFKGVLLGQRKDFAHCTVLILKQIRKCLDEKQAGSSDVEMILHNIARSFTFKDSRIIQKVWSMPGMVNYLLSNDEENLLSEVSLFEIKHFKGYGHTKHGSIASVWTKHVARDEAERQRIENISFKHFELDQQGCMETPSVYKFGFAYLNLIIAAAVRSPTMTMSSVYDAVYGRLRLDPSVDNLSMTVAALRRAMCLWKNNYVRSGLGDATAPAAGLAMVALKTLFESPARDHSCAYVLKHLDETEVIPGLDIAELVVTAIEEVGDMAVSSDLSNKCLKFLAERCETPLISTKWKALSDEKNAQIVLAIMSHVMDEGPLYKEDKDGPMQEKPIANSLLKILETACTCGKDTLADQRRILIVSANNELLGLKNPGRNISTRAVLHYYLDHYEGINGNNIVQAIKWCEKCPTRFALKRLSDGTPEMARYRKMEVYRNLALGDIEEIEYNF